jgi:PmbA protein
MKTKERLELAHWAVEHALKSGATEAAADIVNSRDVEFEIRAKKVDRLQDATSNSLSLTVYADNRYSAHSTSDLRVDALGRFIAEAVRMTKYLTKDEYRFLPEPRYYEGRQEVDLRIFDGGYDGVSPSDREEYARTVEAAARAVSDRILASTAGCGDSSSESVRVTSNGFEGSTNGTVFYASAEVTVKGEGEGRPQDFDWCLSRFRKKMPSPESVGRGAARRALARIGQKPLPTGRYDAIVENRAAGRILGALYSPMRAATIQQKRSFLDGKLGQRIASEKLTVSDDPLVVSGFGSRTFDGEGLTSRKRVMIEKGVLRQFYVDTYYGRKLGWEANGGSPSNVVLEQGDQSLEQLVAQTKRGVLIDSFIGGNSSDITGEFSFGLMGHYIEDGQIARPVNEMNIAGNLLQFFGQLALVGNDPWPYSSMQIPTLVFKDVQFSGV